MADRGGEVDWGRHVRRDREVATQVLFLHQGRVEEQGDPREVLVRPRSERLRQFLAGGLK